MIGITNYLVLSVFYFADTAAQTHNYRTIWQIGKPDRSASEFALAPSQYENFVSGGFGGANRYYIVGKPYVLLGSFDSYIGATFWAGYAMCKLPVYFKVTPDLSELVRYSKFGNNLFQILGYRNSHSHFFVIDLIDKSCIGYPFTFCYEISDR